MHPLNSRDAIEYHNPGHRIQSKDIFDLLMQALIIITCDGSSDTDSFDCLDAVTGSGSSKLYRHALGNERLDTNSVASLIGLLVGACMPGGGQPLLHSMKWSFGWSLESLPIGSGWLKDGFSYCHL